MRWVRDTFGKVRCRETIRAALRRLKLSWKKGKKLLSRADPAKRAAFVTTIQEVLGRAQRDEKLLVYIDEAHIHEDADVGYAWSVRGERLWVCSSSPGLSAKASFYGLHLYNEGQVRIWDYPRGNGDHTVEVFKRLRREFPTRAIRMIWDGAAYHRSGLVQQAAARWHSAGPLLGYSPDFMPIEELWRWLREDVTYNRCHTTRGELIANVRRFEATINGDPVALADRLWSKKRLITGVVARSGSKTGPPLQEWSEWLCKRREPSSLQMSARNYSWKHFGTAKLFQSSARDQGAMRLSGV